MSKRHDKGLRIELSHFYDLSGLPGLRREPHDTDEQYKLGLAQLALERDRILKEKEAARPRLTGNRNAMSSPIELAMREALDPDDLFSVWAALTAISERPDRPAPLMGLTEDGSMVRYRESGKIELFTQAMLKQRLGRQRKSKNGS